MGTRSGSHRLSNGLLVSGRPEHQPKDRQPSMSSLHAAPYTGGDVKKSSEFGKTYGVGDHPSAVAPPNIPSRLTSFSQSGGGSSRSGPSSGQLGYKSDGSGPLFKKSSSSSFSGPATPIQPTGLITSGPLGSNRRSGQLDPPSARGSFKKNVYSAAVTSLGEGEVKLEHNLSRVGVWVFLVVVVMGLVVGVFLMAAVKKAVVLVAAVALIVPAMVIIIWNYAYKKRGALQFLIECPDAQLRGVVDGQYVKITGVVTCGSIPLESSFQRVPRCVYTATELYEYRGCGGKPTSGKQHCFSWACRNSEKYVTDFYISDSKSGLRALVKAGYGAKVAPFVKPTTVDVAKNNKDLSPNFVSWLSDRGLSSNDHVLRLKEGFVKEGSTISVMGIIRCHDNVVMIVPPAEPISTGCRWPCFLLPTYIDGLILTCNENQHGEAIPV